MTAFGAALSEHPDAAAAAGEVIGSVAERVGIGPDVALLFASGYRADEFDMVARAVRSILAPTTLIGSTTSSVIGGALESEHGRALSLWAGRVGAVDPVRLELVRSPRGATVVGLPDAALRGLRTLIVIGEALSFAPEPFLAAVNVRQPGMTIVGGLASPPATVDATRLVLDDATFADGAVGVLLPGGLGEFGIVSQGCRPIGQPFAVTAAEGNRILGLGSQPVLDRLGEVYERASEADRALLSHGLHIGVAVAESAAPPRHGDFLVRAVLGADHAAGALRVGARVPIGATVQFHVRDASSARADLAGCLRTVDADAALVFSSDARGTRLFGVADHDASAIAAATDASAVAGMSCAAEFGPVAGENHVHGSSASMVFLYG